MSQKYYSRILETFTCLLNKARKAFYFKYMKKTAAWTAKNNSILQLLNDARAFRPGPGCFRVSKVATLTAAAAVSRFPSFPACKFTSRVWKVAALEWRNVQRLGVVSPLKATVDHGSNGAMNLDVHTDQI